MRITSCLMIFCEEDAGGADERDVRGGMEKKSMN